MNKYIFVNILIICSVLMIVISCNDDMDKKFPINGEFCFESKTTDMPEYLHVTYIDCKVNGTIYRVEDVIGNVFYNFRGQIVNDSVLKLSIHMTPYEKVDVEEEWIIRWVNSGIQLKNCMGRKDLISYAEMNCDQFYQVVDTSTYASVEAVHEEEIGEYWENEFMVICFKGLFHQQDSSNGKPLYEYIRLRNDRGDITGWGMGTGEGGSHWDFDVKGLLTNDSTITVKVSYRQEGKGVLTIAETWFIDEGREHLRLKEGISGHLGAKTYSKTDCPNELYFESTSPDASRATPLYEYIKISYLNNMVWGTGSGDYMAGSQPWTLFFRGVLSENNMTLNVTYRQIGEASSTTSEVWTLDLKAGRLYRKDWAGSKNPMGASEYHKIESYEIPKEHADNMVEISPN